MQHAAPDDGSAALSAETRHSALLLLGAVGGMGGIAALLAVLISWFSG